VCPRSVQCNCVTSVRSKFLRLINFVTPVLKLINLGFRSDALRDAAGAGSICGLMSEPKTPAPTQAQHPQYPGPGQWNTPALPLDPSHLSSMSARARRTAAVLSAPAFRSGGWWALISYAHSSTDLKESCLPLPATGPGSGCSIYLLLDAATRAKELRYSQEPFRQSLRRVSGSTAAPCDRFTRLKTSPTALPCLLFFLLRSPNPTRICLRLVA
jgi:hypothetical protein